MLTPVTTTEPKTTITDMPPVGGGKTAVPARRRRWALDSLLQVPAATVGLAREAL
jgi:hypothetical protein